MLVQKEEEKKGMVHSPLHKNWHSYTVQTTNRRKALYLMKAAAKIAEMINAQDDLEDFDALEENDDYDDSLSFTGILNMSFGGFRVCHLGFLSVLSACSSWVSDLSVCFLGFQVGFLPFLCVGSRLMYVSVSEILSIFVSVSKINKIFFAEEKKQSTICC